MKKTTQKPEEAIRNVGGAVIELLAAKLKVHLGDVERGEFLNEVALQVERHAKIAEGTATALDHAWVKGHSPDPVEVRAQAILFGQGVPNAQ